MDQNIRRIRVKKRLQAKLDITDGLTLPESLIYDNRETFFNHYKQPTMNDIYRASFMNEHHISKLIGIDELENNLYIFDK
jgi:hypothetical protein